MTLPSNENLTAKLDKADPSLRQRMANLQASLKAAYKAAGLANEKAHRENKSYYDRRAKHREFRVGASVYLYNPAVKRGLSRV
jgi:hypothetical protein